MMRIKEELKDILGKIDVLLFNKYISTEERATLLVARANTLIALQKYEVGGYLD